MRPTVWHDPGVATDLARLHAVFDLAMRIGEGMLTNGAAASEVTATVLRIISSSGIRNVSVTVTFDEVSISYLPDPEAAPFTRIRAAGARIQDFTKLEAFEQIAEDYVKGAATLEESTARIALVPSAAPSYPSWLVAAALALMGGAAAYGLGAGILVTLAATATAAFLAVQTESLVRRRIPLFYVQAAGGFVAAAAAIAVHLIDPARSSSIVVVACLIILLAGLTSIGAMQDAITGWYVTASARMVETIMLTVGLIVGVRGGLLAADLLGADLSVSAPMSVSLSSVPVVLVSGALMGLGYAISVQTPPRSLAWCAVIAAVSALGANLLTDTGIERVWAVGATSLAAGVIAVLMAQQVRAPALTFVMAGVIPLVPGSRIYAGLLLIGTDLTAGAAKLFEAGEVAVALAAGAVLGQLLAARALGATGRAVSAFTPVIAAPFTTPRRRRQVAGSPRGGRRGGSTIAAERTTPSTSQPSEPRHDRAADQEETP